MKVFLTGASGLVGAAFAQAAARRGHHVIGATHRYADAIAGLRARLTVDLSDPAAVTGPVLEHFPDAIVNCAALSMPDECDRQPALAQALNVDLPAQLARLAHHLSARFVHISSEQVFPGTAPGTYAAGDPPEPINLYGRQKLASEQAVAAAAAEFAVTVRAPLLLGNSPGGGRSLHERLFADWAAGRTPRLFTDEFRQPCTAENLAEVLLELCERRDVRGVCHWAGTELVSRLELAERVRTHFKLTPQQAPLAATTRADQAEAARRRPARLALDLRPLAGRLRTQPEPLAAALESLHVPPAARAWYLG
ncbi:MAG: SDR family oxidoreductase [Opitutaceae bacterium]